jgi:DNA helicase II / ATP-dependent DNA helicase PcrA
MKFDTEKLTAIEHTGSHLLVTAGPGSGKTRVITERIKFLLKTNLKHFEMFYSFSL